MTSTSFIAFAERLKTLIAAAGVAALLGLGVQSAYAADQAAPAFKIDPKVQAQAMTEAPGLIAAAHVKCDPSDAYMLGSTDLQKDGKKVKGSLYEIACKTGPGFLATAYSPTDVAQAFTCTLAASEKARQPTAASCVLPENQPDYKWLTPVVQPYLPNCVVNNARVMGSTPPDSKDPKIDRYEVGCESGIGGIIDYPQLGSDAPINYVSCLIGADKGFACQYTSTDAIVASLKPVAAKADADCQVNNVRFVGVTKESDGFFYEFGCANKPGFIVLTGNDNSFKQSLPCAQAASLGGCKFTDAGAAAADAKTTFTQTLKTGGYTCTVQDYNVIGTQPQTKRDYVEFKCPEQPWGLIGFVPQPGSDSSLHVKDCFIEQSTRADCTFTTEDQLKAQLDKLIKAAEPGKDCDVKQVRYIGESAETENALIAELACVNKRGYIVVVAPDRKSLDATPCKLTKAHGLDQSCTIPDNGTYAD
jgi:hypothetical protein